MGRYVIETEVVSAAPPAAVWALLADVTTWSDWGPWEESAREREGTPAPDGVGAVRRFKRGPSKSVEEVTAFDPPHRLGYRLLSGLPLEDYRAEVTLDDVGGSTRIRWRSEFDGKYPLVGPIFKVALGRFIRDVATRLGTASARATMD